MKRDDKKSADDSHRKFKLVGGGPLEGVVARHYPDTVSTKDGRRVVWNDIVVKGGVYMAPQRSEIPDKGKKGEMRWLAEQHANLRKTP